VAAGAVGGAMIGACAIALVVLPRRVQGVTAYPSNG
jgi:hypothetical protein